MNSSNHQIPFNQDNALEPGDAHRVDSANARVVTLCRQHPILSAGGEALCDALAGRYPAVQLAAGEELVAAGDAVHTVDFLLDGFVRVYQRCVDGRELLSRMVEGPSVFGDAELLQDVPHARGAEVLEASWFLRVPADDYRRLLEEHPALMRAELSHLAALTYLDARNELIVFGSLEQRVANALLAYARRYGRQVADGSISIDYPVSLKLLAREIGAVWRSVGHVLTGMRKRGLLSKSGDRTVIDKPAELAELASMISGGLSYSIGEPVETNARKPRRPPSAEVEIAAGPAMYQGQQVWIEEEIVIGSESPVDLLLMDACPRHCRIFRSATGGRYWVQDLNSEAGTRVNGESVRRAVLRDGDRITIGKAELVFRTTNADRDESAAELRPYFNEAPGSSRNAD